MVPLPAPTHPHTCVASVPNTRGLECVVRERRLVRSTVTTCRTIVRTRRARGCVCARPRARATMRMRRARHRHVATSPRRRPVCLLHVHLSPQLRRSPACFPTRTQVSTETNALCGGAWQQRRQHAPRAVLRARRQRHALMRCLAAAARCRCACPCHPRRRAMGCAGHLHPAPCAIPAGPLQRRRPLLCYRPMGLAVGCCCSRPRRPGDPPLILSRGMVAESCRARGLAHTGRGRRPAAPSARA